MWITSKKSLLWKTSVFIHRAVKKTDPADFFLSTDQILLQKKEDHYNMTLRYLLDINICIYTAKQHPEYAPTKFEKLYVGEAGISVVTYGELLHGSNESNLKQKTISILDELFNLIAPLPMSIDVGKNYEIIRSNLEKQGNIIGANDLWIAAHFLSLN